MFEITIKATNVEEFKKIVLDLAGPQVHVHHTTPLSDIADTKKKTKTKAPKIEVEAASQVEAVAPVAATPAPKATREAAMDALKNLTEKKSIESARGVLLTFGCARFSELKDEQFDGFIMACASEAQKV